MDEYAVRSDAERGAQAERLLESDLLKEAFTALEAEYLNAWKATGARDTEARERLWQAFQIVGKVKTHLATVAANGNLAQKELAEIEAMGERKKVLGIF
jgi:hypothetical protein